MVNEPAGFWIRLGAGLLDSLIISIPLGLIGFILTGDFENNFFSNTLQFLYTLLVPVIWYGYTVGKRICGIRIVKVNGERLGIGAMLLRTVIAGIIYGLTLGIAVIVSAFMVGIREDKRAIHDLIAGTYVTYKKPE